MMNPRCRVVGGSRRGNSPFAAIKGVAELAEPRASSGPLTSQLVSATAIKLSMSVVTTSSTPKRARKTPGPTSQRPPIKEAIANATKIISEIETFFQAGETYIQIVAGVDQRLQVAIQHLHPSLERTKAGFQRGETQIELIEDVIALEDADDDANQNREGRNANGKVELDVVHQTFSLVSSLGLTLGANFERSHRIR